MKKVCRYNAFIIGIILHFVKIFGYYSFSRVCVYARFSVCPTLLLTDLVPFPEVHLPAQWEPKQSAAKKIQTQQPRGPTRDASREAPSPRRA